MRLFNECTRRCSQSKVASQETSCYCCCVLILNQCRMRITEHNFYLLAILDLGRDLVCLTLAVTLCAWPWQWPFYLWPWQCPYCPSPWPSPCIDSLVWPHQEAVTNVREMGFFINSKDIFWLICMHHIHEQTSVLNLDDQTCSFFKFPSCPAKILNSRKKLDWLRYVVVCRVEFKVHSHCEKGTRKRCRIQ